MKCFKCLKEASSYDSVYELYKCNNRECTVGFIDARNNLFHDIVTGVWVKIPKKPEPEVFGFI